MLLWPACNRAPGAHSTSCHTAVKRRDICAAPLQRMPSLKSHIICTEKTRLVISIASSCVCSMQLASPRRESAGKAAVKIHLTSHGLSTVCFHHDQKLWKTGRKKLTSRARTAIFLLEYDATDCKAISKGGSFLHMFILKMDRVSQMCGFM